MKITLPYSHEDFTIPPNLYIIGTMNTADRSIALLDSALRRRFHFIEYMPDLNYVDDRNVIQGLSFSAREFLKKLNYSISLLLDPDHQIGHSYFMENGQSIDFSNKFERFKEIWYYQIIPLIREYFYNDWDKLKYLLGDFLIMEYGKFEESKLINELNKDFDLQSGTMKSFDYITENDFEKLYDNWLMLDKAKRHETLITPDIEKDSNGAPVKQENLN